MDRLRRRRDFLANRVRNYRSDGNPSYDKAELHALNWAISIIQNCDIAGILDDVSKGNV